MVRSGSTPIRRSRGSSKDRSPRATHPNGWAELPPCRPRGDLNHDHVSIGWSRAAPPRPNGPVGRRGLGGRTPGLIRETRWMTDLRRPAAVWRMEGGPADEPAPSHPTAPTGSGGQDASGVDAVGRPAAVASDVGRVPHERIPARRTTVAGGTNRVDSPRRSERTRRRGGANPRLVESANPIQVRHVRRAGRVPGSDDPGSEGVCADDLDSEGVGSEHVGSQQDVPTRHPPIGFRRHEWSTDDTNRAARAA